MAHVSITMRGLSSFKAFISGLLSTAKKTPH